MRLMSDLLPPLIASADGQLGHFDLRWYPETAMTVVMAANGYPGSYEKDTRISGAEDQDSEDLVVFTPERSVLMMVRFWPTVGGCSA